MVIEAIFGHIGDMPEFTHFDERGASRMVDVGAKSETPRRARASGCVAMLPTTLTKIRAGEMGKGNVLEVARLAAIMATKRTDELIPLCHSLPLTSVVVDFDFPDPQTLRVEVEVTTVARTGVEMEALTGVMVATLTVYDMCKAVDRGMVVRQVQLEEKLGGASGHYQRSSSARQE